MSYSHYGKQAEVWKHLPLCDIIALEQPTLYVETNSAYANYSIGQTPEQLYGIYHFLEKAKSHPIKSSIYYQLENAAIQTGQYMGSPALAMSILENRSQYIFYDLDKEALSNVKIFGKTHNLSKFIQLRNQDSISGMMELLPQLPETTLIHVDPYTINDPNKEGHTYLDVFTRATKLGLKCFLWYGYQTLKDKKELEQLITSSCKECASHSLSCHELTLRIIEQDTMPCMPGVLGSGLLTSNLLSASREKIEEYCNLLIDFYQGATYKEFSGELYKDRIL